MVHGVERDVRWEAQTGIGAGDRREGRDVAAGRAPIFGDAVRRGICDVDLVPDDVARRGLWLLERLRVIDGRKRHIRRRRSSAGTSHQEQTYGRPDNSLELHQRRTATIASIISPLQGAWAEPFELRMRAGVRKSGLRGRLRLPTVRTCSGLLQR